MRSAVLELAVRTWQAHSTVAEMCVSFIKIHKEVEVADSLTHSAVTHLVLKAFVSLFRSSRGERPRFLSPIPPHMWLPVAGGRPEMVGRLGK